MRVLAVSSYGVLGGAELALSAFIRHRPPEADVRALLLADGPLRDALSEQGIAVLSARGQDGRPRPRSFVAFSRAFRPLLARERPDVVWAVGQKAALLCAPGCRLGGVPLAWHKVDFSWDSLLARPLALASDGVLATSEAVTAAIGELRTRRPPVVVGVPITLPDELRARPDPERPVMGTLGRLVPYKGHHLLIEAAALLRDEFPELRLVLAGGPVREYPDYPDALRRLAQDHRLDGRVEMPGFVTDVSAVLERMSVFVNATYRDEDGFGLEALGAGLVEASWAGVPTVAPRQGGTVEAVVDGVTGTLVPEADPAALAEAAARYLRDPELAARTGEAGRAFARERYRPDSAAGRLWTALRAIAEGGGAAPTMPARLG